jgi:glycerate kinase
VEAVYAWLPDTRVAVVEMAQASGLPLLSASERAPLRTTTLGPGQVLRHALARRPREILLTLGGSATVDGGVGAARALGWRFLDRAGHHVVLGGGGLERIHRIRPPFPDLKLPPVTVLCDVRNPLCGPDGAASVFGPQKGATPGQVMLLDRGLRSLSDRILAELGLGLAEVPGAGAAGGFGAGAMAFLGGRLTPGFDAVARVVGLERALANCDLVVTGEGMLDASSLQGKVVGRVAALGAAAGVPVIAVVGQCSLGAEACRAAGLARVICLDQLAGGLKFALGQPRAALAAAARALAAALG